MVIETTMTLACGLVAKNQMMIQARTVDLPGPLQAFIASSGLTAASSRASSCQASGSASSCSRTKATGFR
jgi:hypothetical protein